MLLDVSGQGMYHLPRPLSDVPDIVRGAEVIVRGLVLCVGAGTRIIVVVWLVENAVVLPSVAVSHNDIACRTGEAGARPQ